ncbi:MULTISPECIES: phosphopantetheine-binding protein [Agarivorans]|uniref:phosphopantetheine-binding protein n=1 Tax=Agarivorans TaxID=261825 RepID=UPI001C80F561|nr:phosphopantetheine-binding protein [Agarivorans aestuarii]
MNLLEQELKQLIIEALELEDVEISDIETDEPLFVEGLGLDSIDALELGLAIKKKYQIKLDANSEDTKRHFSSVKALAEFIEQEKKAA